MRTVFPPAEAIGRLGVGLDPESPISLLRRAPRGVVARYHLIIEFRVGSGMRRAVAKVQASEEVVQVPRRGKRGDFRGPRGEI